MTTRIAEAHALVRRYIGTPYESAALAYLAAQAEIAGRCRRG